MINQHQHAVRFFLCRHPIIKWAQRKDKCYIEIGLRDILEEKIDLSPTKISFNGVSDKKKYGFEIELY